MGLLTAIILALALLADFFFLPALLMKLEGQEDVPVVASVTSTDCTPV